jgi:GT2 family glycosyltransferase
MDKPIAIIMPVHNSGKWLDIALKHLYASTDYPFILYLIESESTDGTAECCDSWAEFKSNIRVFHTKKEGLVKAFNFGIKQAGDLDVYLTQDDVIHNKIYRADWLEYMHEISKEFGVVVTKGGGGISGPDYIDGLMWFGTWSVLITRETINKVGLLDEEFGPGDDIDYTYRCYKEGVKIGGIDVWFEHHRLSEHFCDSEEKRQQMAIKFRKKWKLGEFK